VRNFGIWGKHLNVQTERESSDCLIKTQDYAKSVDDVYGLRSAKCYVNNFLST